jgi:hypothetical protein
VITSDDLLVTDSSLFVFVRDPPRRRGKGSSRSKHLVLVRTKGELYLCAGAPTRTSGVSTFLYLGKNSEEFSCPCFTFRDYFEQFALSFYIPSSCHDDLGFV